MARKSLTETLPAEPTPPAEPPFAPELIHGSAPDPAPASDSSGSTPAAEERYKFTANLNGAEYDQLEALTSAVVAELAPRPVGKGWRAKVVRALIALAVDDPKLRHRVVARLRKG